MHAAGWTIPRPAVTEDQIADHMTHLQNEGVLDEVLAEFDALDRGEFPTDLEDADALVARLEAKYITE